MRELEGKVAIVTGGASGIGAALGVELTRRGARVVLCDRNPGPKIARLDVTDAAAFRALAEETRAREGRVDYLFNNAGIGLAGELRDTELADWRRVLDVNVWGVIHGVAAVYPIMLAQGSGHIVNTGSGAGLLPRPGMAAYAAAKHAVVGLSTSLRAEAADLGVKVSVVCPGFVATRILASTTYKNLDSEGLLARMPIKPISAETCARRILRGVARNQAIITVDRLIQIEWLLYRLWPELGVRISRLRGSRVRAARKAA